MTNRWQKGARTAAVGTAAVGAAVVDALFASGAQDAGTRRKWGQMRRIAAATLVVVGLLVGGGTPVPAAGELATDAPDDPLGAAAIIEDGSIDGAPYVIAVPRRNWNGTVVVYAGGTRDRKDDEQEMEDRSPPTGPSGARFIGVVAGEPLSVSGIDAFTLVARGYAWASTARKQNGYAVREGLDDLRNLVAYFKRFAARQDVRAAGAFERTIGFACSQGTVEAYKMAENNDRHGFDGVVSLAGLGGGWPRTMDTLLAYQLAWDVAFGWPAAWGKVGDVRNKGDHSSFPEDLDFEQEVAPTVDRNVATSGGLARLEFIRLVIGGTPPVPEPPAAWYASYGKTVAYFATEFAAEVEATSGGPPYQNLDHHYKLSDAGRLYLRGLDPGFDVEAALEAMNDRTTYSPASGPRAFVEKYAEFSGQLKRPVLTLKGEDDYVAPWHDRIYAEEVAKAGKSHLLRQLFVKGPSLAGGHCAGFTQQQILTAIGAMEAWIGEGVAPNRNSVQFLAAGFDPFYVPPPWPFK